MKAITLQLIFNTDYFCYALDITNGRFISESENILASSSTVEYLEVAKLRKFK